ncbi:MAG: fibronectin-binding protein [Mycobacterium sp.]
MLVRIAALTGALALTGAVLAAPAPAEPMPQCELALAFICGMLPAMPDLDHDINLDHDVPPANSLPETQFADPCALGCI